MKGTPEILALLNERLSEELTAISMYMVHSEMCANWGYDKLHEAFEKQAIDEMKHAEMLIGRILFLEGAPTVSKLQPMTIGATVEQMVKADEDAETGAIKAYNEVFVPGKSDPELIPKASSSLRLLQQISDEAHRFAITYHRTLRTNRTLQTELDLIEGIGKKRAKELLEAFGSVQGVKFATEAQLAEIVGPKVAAKIREYFEPEETEGPTRNGELGSGNSEG